MKLVPSRVRRLLSKTDGDGGGPSFDRNAGIAFVSQVTGAGLQYIVHLFFARWAGAEAYGIYTYALAWATFLALPATLGLPATFLRFLPEYKARGEWSYLHGLIGLSTRRVLASSLLLALIGTGYTLASRSGWQHDAVAGTLIAAFWSIPLLSLSRVQSELCRAQEQIVLAYTVPLALRPLATLLGGMLGYRVTGSLSSMMALALAVLPTLPVWLLQRHAFRRGLPRPVLQSPPTYDEARWFRMALPLLLTTGLVTLLGQADLLLVGLLRSPEEAGWYLAAQRTAGLAGFVYGAVTAAATPRFATLYARREGAALHGLLTRLAHWLFWPTLGLGLLLWAGSAFILKLFGPGFVAAQPALLLLLLNYVANAAVGPAGALLSVTGHHNAVLRVYAWATALNLALGVAGAARFGTAGAAAATLFATTFANLWLLLLTRRRLGLAPSVFSAFGR